MKPVWGLVLVLFTIAGCAGVATRSDQTSDPSNTTQSSQRSIGSSSDAFTPPDPTPMFPSNTGPQPVLPASGGSPVIGIPLGGNIYLPVTGGPPVVGIPLAP